MATALKISAKVVFLRSITNDERVLLLERTNVLLYTPENEHFGIVPVEAMYMGCIVIACDSGGPLESIENNGKTGYLLPPNPKIWAETMLRIFKMKEKERKVMKDIAKERVR